jgi:hypothetical protein
MIMKHKHKYENNRPQNKIQNFFGQYLINRGLIDEDVLLHALNIQRKKSTPIGELAIMKKYVKVSEVLDILNSQINTPYSFGEMGIKMGYLTKNKVDNLMELQSESRPNLGSILLSMNAVNAEVLKNELILFFRFIGKEEVII